MDPCFSLRRFYSKWSEQSGLIPTTERDATTWLVLGPNGSATTVRCERLFWGHAAAFSTRTIAGKEEPARAQKTFFATGAIDVVPSTNKAMIPWFIFKTTVTLPTPDPEIKIEHGS